MDPIDGNGFEPDGSADSSTADPQLDPQTPTGAASGGDPGGGQPDRERYIPRERFDEVNNQLRLTRQQVQALEQRFTGIGDALAGRPGGTAPLDPKREQIRAQLFELVPEFREFVDNREAILRAGNLAGTSEEHITAYWANHGQMMAGELRNAMAPMYGDQPSDEAVGAIMSNFTAWLEADPTKQQRYVRGDKALVGDFWKWYEGAVLQPARRTQNVSLLQRGQQVNRLPSRGPANQPVTPAAPKPKNADELWDMAFDRFQADTAPR